MKAGSLRHRVEFQTNVPTANSIGEYVDTWSKTLTVWGADRPLSGNRLFTAQQANSEVKGEVEIRYRDDILATMRMVTDGRTLQIIAIQNPEQRNERLIVQYKEALD